MSDPIQVASTKTFPNILNLTPHQIAIQHTSGGVNVVDLIPASGKEVRLNNKPQTHLFEHDEIPIYSPPQYEPTIEWPEIASHVSAVLVSMPVGQLVAELSKNPEFNLPFMVFGPDTGPSAVVRSSTGQIIGTKRFICYYNKGTPLNPF